MDELLKRININLKIEYWYGFAVWIIDTFGANHYVISGSEWEFLNSLDEHEIWDGGKFTVN